jgi:hypothetical protein
MKNEPLVRQKHIKKKNICYGDSLTGHSLHAFTVYIALLRLSVALLFLSAITIINFLLLIEGLLILS